MILFDNIYYLLYYYFKRTNSGTFGYKLTSISLTSLYIYTFVCLFYSLITILYYLFVFDSSNTTILQNRTFPLVNEDFVMLGSIICFIYSNIRYFAFKNINKINKMISDMDRNKRERINVLSVSYMVASPVLLFFLANYVKDLCR